MQKSNPPAPVEKPEAVIQKQKDELEEIANVVFFAIDTPPVNLSKPTPAYTKRDGWLHDHGTGKGEDK